MRHVIGWAIGCLLAAVALPPIQMAVGAGYAAVQRRLAVGVLEGKHTATSPAEVAFLGVCSSAPPVEERRGTPPHPVRPRTGRTGVPWAHSGPEDFTFRQIAAASLLARCCAPADLLKCGERVDQTEPVIDSVAPASRPTEYTANRRRCRAGLDGRGDFGAV